MSLVVGFIAGLMLLLLLAGGALVFWLRRRKALIAHAQVLIGWGDFEGASKDFLAAGKWFDAAQSLAKAGQRLQAIELFLKHRKIEDALDVLAEATVQELEQAEQVFANRKLLEAPKTQRRLAELARDGGAYKMATRFYEHLGDEEEMRVSQLHFAQALASAGQMLDAARLYSELGETRQAAMAHLEAARLERDPTTANALARTAAKEFISLDDPEKAVEAFALAGDVEQVVDLLLKSGQEARAAAFLDRGGHWFQAAVLYEKLGDLISAARVHRKDGQFEKAAMLLETVGNHVEAARCFVEMRDFMRAAQVLLQGGEIEGALQYFSKVEDKDLPKAADLLVMAGHIKRAVQLLAQRNQVRAAADLLRANGMAEMASELLAQLGDRFEKAKVLASRGQYEEAANILIELGKTEEAYAMLKEAPSLETPGRMLLAGLALQLEASEEAIELYSKLLESGVSGDDREEVLYGLSRAFEAASKFFEASATLQELLSIAPNHRDAALRLRLIQGRFPPPSAPMLGTSLSRPTTEERSDGLGSSGLPSRYRIVSEIARGSMGVVYRAIDDQLSRPVAIKLLAPQAGNNARIREYFLREARSVARLNHPNIVTVYDAGLQESSPWLVMELVEGDDLRTRFQRGRPPLMQSIRIGSQVASALDCAHSHGIIHRDLKPENIMLTKDGTAKLMDFGIAYVMKTSGDSEKRRNTVVGTPVYMAPEQIKGETIDSHTDIYSLGVVLFECFCGRLPFDPSAAMFHHTNTPAPDPLLYRPDLPVELAELILQCLEKSPDKRPQKVSHLQRVLMTVGSKMVKAQRGAGIR